jgi:UDP-2,3-diacylglucosamine hydrolase
VRLLGAIAKITDLGIPVHYHLGNHDLWSFGYLESELGVQIHTSPIVREWDGLKCLIGHGDGLGPGDRGYKLTKKVYRSKLAQFLFRWLHPDLGIRLANRLSKNSRSAGGKSGGPFTSPEKENLYQYCKEVLESDPGMNCFIFGHRHLPLDLTISNDTESSAPARYINIGDWITHFSSAKIEKGILTLNT